MAGAVKQIPEGVAQNITNVQQITKAFADTIKSFEKTDPSAIKKSVAIYSDISKYLKVFLKSTQDMMQVIKTSFDSDMKKEAIKLTQDMVKVVESSIKVVETLGNMKFPKMLKLKIQLWKFKKEFGMILDMFLNPETGLATMINVFDQARDIEVPDGEGKVKIIHISNIKNTKSATVALDDIMTGIQEILKKTSQISIKSIIFYPIIKLGLSFLIGNEKRKGIMTMLMEMLDSETFKKLTEDETKDSIENATESNIMLGNLFISFDHLFDKISIGLLIKAKIASMCIDSILQSATYIVNKIAKWSQGIDEQMVADVREKVSIVADVVNSLVSMIGGVVILALCLPIIILAAPLAILSVAVLGLFVRGVAWALRPMRNKAIDRSIVISCKDLLQIIALLLATMAMVLMGMALLALLGIQLAKLFKPAILTFLVATAIVVAFALLGVLISKIFRKAKIGAEVWFGLLLILALVGLMLIVGLALLTMAWLGKMLWGKVKDIAKAFLVIIIVLGVIVLLGLASKFTMPFFAAAAIVLSLTFIAVTMILLILFELKFLAWAVKEFNEEEKERIKQHVRLVVNTALEIITSMFFGNEDLDKNAKAQSDKTKNSPFRRFFSSLFKGAAMIIEALCACIILIFTTVSLAMIIIIALELKLLVKMKVPDENTVNNKVQNIMQGAQNCIDAVFGENPKEKEDSGGWFKKAIMKFFKGLIDIIVIICAIGKLALTMVAIGLILLIAQELKWISKFDTGKITNVESNVTKIMTAAETCIAAVFGENDKKQEKSGGWFKKAIMKFIKGLVDIIEIICAIGKLALTMVAIGLIVGIAKELVEMSKIEVPDPGKIKDKVQDIMDGATHCINAIFGYNPKKQEDSGGWLRKAIEWLLPDSWVFMIDVVCAIGKLALTVSAIGMIVTIGKDLEYIEQVRINPERIKEKINEIMNGGTACIEAIFTRCDKEPDNSGSWLEGGIDVPTFGNAAADKFISFLKKGWNFLKKIGRVILIYVSVALFHSIAASLDEINKIEFNLPAFKNKVSDIVNASVTITNEVLDSDSFKKLKEGKYYKGNLDDNLKAVDKLSTTLSKIVSIDFENKIGKYKEGLDKTIEFLDKVDTIKVENLETATKMFSKMADFSRTINGNFQELAKTLNEHVVVMLEKLNNTLDDTNTKISDLRAASENISGALVADGDGGYSVATSSFNATDRSRLSSIATAIEKLAGTVDTYGTSKIRTKES